MKTNQKGFSAVETLLIVIVAGILALAGWYVWKENHGDSSKDNSAATQTQKADPEKSDPYAGWKNAELVYEKLTYKYPADWSQQSEAIPGGRAGTIKPGSDELTLTGSDSDLQIIVRTGLDGVGSAVGQIVTDSVPVTLLGGQHYLNFYTFEDAEDKQQVYGGCVDATETSADKLPGKNITRTDGEKMPMSLCVRYPRAQGDTLVLKTVDEYKSDPSFADAKLILESFTY